MELNQQVDEPIFHETGGLYISRRDSSFAPDSIAAAQAHGLPHEVVDATVIRDRWPVFDCTDDMVGLFEPLAGLIVPERALAAHATIARRAGARLREGVTVSAWRANTVGVEVDTSEGLMRADALVLCTGAWPGPLVGVPAIEMRPSRQVLVWFDAPAEARIDAPDLPVWAIELNDASLLYGFPRMPGLPGPEGFKAARHWPGPTVDPDDVPAMAVRDDDAMDVAPHLARWLPSAAGPAGTVHTCLYANSRDGHFRIGLHPDHPQVTIVSCLSGHGFKFQPVLGEVAADLALSGQSALDIDFLAPHA
jgi:sarcosine oxidase